MQFTPQDVAKVAALARLNLAEEKLAAFAGQFNAILEYMDQLGQVDTTGVEPLYGPVEEPKPLREDVARQDFTRDEVLANAPATDGRFFIVPRIV
jgi:aspartyl-tRNA(Asn)/glutamyl-tRNA(Gln) amidotransferase subunit C